MRFDRLTSTFIFLFSSLFNMYVCVCACYIDSFIEKEIEHKYIYVD